MKLIKGTILLILIIGGFSCHSGSKKVKAYTPRVITRQQTDSTKIDSAINNNSSLDVERDTSQPLMSKVIFPNFSVKVKNSAFGGYKDDNNKLVYSGGTNTDKADVSN
ncbi:hypothetical protein HDF18_00460 [Mucilaginibacter sp. X5P1]|uniref:hypothetical protein n=1 Tax=Mucilaginibacter sp. X5P1 TaxID=2723088 RepID=UPI001615BC6B|nr:hypothetical protein [Mucilaginibacter sp. X5P1]MBB6138432.1 hypothetical protein [Mucilaginibacter sp. X5P1]